MTNVKVFLDMFEEVSTTYSIPYMVDQQLRQATPPKAILCLLPLWEFEEVPGPTTAVMQVFLICKY